MAVAVAFVALGLGVSAQKQAYKQKLEKVTDVNAAVKAFERIIPRYAPADIAPLADALCAKFGKSPAIYVGLANAFAYKSGVGDTARAYSYLKRAVAVDPRYAPAYVMYGDLAWSYDDTLRSANWYRRAIEANPHELTGYRQLAMIYRKQEKMDSVEAVYRQCKEANPTFPSNLRLATMYQRSTKLSELNKAMQYYAVSERDSMAPADYTSYARLYNMLAETQGSATEKYVSYKKMFDICKEGLDAHPDEYYLLSIGLQAALKAYGQVRTNAELRMPMVNSAVDYGERLVKKYEGDTLLNSSDINNYALALKYKNRYDDAINVFQKVIDFSKSTDEQRSKAMGNIAEAYGELGEYDKADAVFAKAIKQKKADGTLTYFDMQQYAQMYINKANEMNGQDKIDAYMKADAIYGQAAELFVDYAEYAYSQQVGIRAQEAIDPGRKNALFLEPARKLWNLMMAKGTLNDSQKALLLNPVLFMGWYYTMEKKKLPVGKQYWLKAYELRPDHKTVREVLEKVYKMKL